MLVRLADLVGPQPLHLTRERMCHRLDVAGLDGRQLLDEVDDPRQAVDVRRHLRLCDLEAREPGDSFDLCAR